MGLRIRKLKEVFTLKVKAVPGEEDRVEAAVLELTGKLSTTQLEQIAVAFRNPVTLKTALSYLK